MEKYIKWRDKSFLTNSQTESWVPEAIADLVEGATCISCLLHLPDSEHDAIKKGELRYSTREQSKIKAYDLVRNHAWKEWGIPAEKIQEY